MEDGHHGSVQGVWVVGGPDSCRGHPQLRLCGPARLLPVPARGSDPLVCWVWQLQGTGTGSAGLEVECNRILRADTMYKSRRCNTDVVLRPMHAGVRVNDRRCTEWQEKRDAWAYCGDIHKTSGRQSLCTCTNSIGELCTRASKNGGPPGLAGSYRGADAADTSARLPGRAASEVAHSPPTSLRPASDLARSGERPRVSPEAASCSDGLYETSRTDHRHCRCRASVQRIHGDAHPT